MIPALVVPETPESPHADVVPVTPSTPPCPSSSQDRVLALTLQANAPGFRKRRLGLGLSPDIQVSSPPPKFRLLNARLNISNLFNWCVSIKWVRVIACGIVFSFLVLL